MVYLGWFFTYSQYREEYVFCVIENRPSAYAELMRFIARFNGYPERFIMFTLQYFEHGQQIVRYFVSVFIIIFYIIGVFIHLAEVVKQVLYIMRFLVQRYCGRIGVHYKKRIGHIFNNRFELLELLK